MHAGMNDELPSGVVVPDLLDGAEPIAVTMDTTPQIVPPPAYPSYLSRWDAIASAHARARRSMNALRAKMESRTFTRGRARMWLLRGMMEWFKAPGGYGHCSCIGKRSGQPLCPCRMKASVFEVNGRWTKVGGLPFWLKLDDLGPVRKH